MGVRSRRISSVLAVLLLQHRSSGTRPRASGFPLLAELEVNGTGLFDSNDTGDPHHTSGMVGHAPKGHEVVTCETKTGGACGPEAKATCKQGRCCSEFFWCEAPPKGHSCPQPEYSNDADDKCGPEKGHPHVCEKEKGNQCGPEIKAVCAKGRCCSKNYWCTGIPTEGHDLHCPWHLFNNDEGSVCSDYDKNLEEKKKDIEEKKKKKEDEEKATDNAEACGEDTAWNETTKKCEVTHEACGDNTHWDKLSKKCEACGQDTEWNETSKTCEACGEDTEWNEKSRKCEAAKAYLAGNQDGTCPEGSIRVAVEECQTLGGKTLATGDQLKAYKEEKCEAVAGTGCWRDADGALWGGVECQAEAEIEGNVALCKRQEADEADDAKGTASLEPLPELLDDCDD